MYTNFTPAITQKHTHTLSSSLLLLAAFFCTGLLISDQCLFSRGVDNYRLTAECEYYASFVNGFYCPQIFHFSRLLFLQSFLLIGLPLLNRTKILKQSFSTNISNLYHFWVLLYTMLLHKYVEIYSFYR